MPSILIATRNRWKLKLFAPIFQSCGFNALSLSDIPAPKTLPVEDGATVVANALIKARHYHAAQYPWVFADDSGLEIDALGGEPGVQSRRWGGHFNDDVDDQTWLDYLLMRLDGVPLAARSAHFVDGWALIDPRGGEHTREQRADFQIALQPVRPIPPDSPVMALALGLPEDPAQIFAEANALWQAWGILEKLRASKILEG